MITTLLSFIAPHYCCGCGKVGGILCDDCKYNIVCEPFSVCLDCGRPVGRKGVCLQRRLPYERAWCAGERKDVLERVIDNYKFHYVKDSYKTLGDILLARLDELPVNTIIVPIPTVNAHIRQRGYDHMLLIARYVARERGLTYAEALRRSTDTKQRDASRRKRIKQAKEAFMVQGKIDPHAIYLLIDDVVTTGATVYYGAKVLKEAGATVVWVGAVARQPLD